MARKVIETVSICCDKCGASIDESYLEGFDIDVCYTCVAKFVQSIKHPDIDPDEWVVSDATPIVKTTKIKSKKKTKKKSSIIINPDEVDMDKEIAEYEKKEAKKKKSKKKKKKSKAELEKLLTKKDFNGIIPDSYLDDDDFKSMKADKNKSRAVRERMDEMRESRTSITQILHPKSCMCSDGKGISRYTLEEGKGFVCKKCGKPMPAVL